MAEAGKEDYARMWTGWNSLTVWMPRRMTRVFPGGMLIMSECETAGGGVGDFINPNPGIHQRGAC